jgi:hypothetical protein
MQKTANGGVDAAAVNHVTDKLSITDYVIPLASNDLLGRPLLAPHDSTLNGSPSLPRKTGLIRTNSRTATARPNIPTTQVLLI